MDPTTAALLRLVDRLGPEAIADALGITRNAVLRWRRGENRPSWENLAQLRRTFKVDLNRLVAGR